MAERINRKVTGSTSSISDTAPGVGGGTTTSNAFNQTVHDASSFSITLDSGTRNAIQWIAAKKHILIGTTGGEWRMGGHSNKPFTPTNFDLKQQTNRGSKDLQPILISDAIAFVNETGRKLHKLAFNGVSEDYETPDLTILAEHISKSGITSMAFQRNPDEILWATLADGTLISMTYDPIQNVIAWARHPLPTGDSSQVVSEEVPAATATYTLTIISENGSVWYIPLGDGGMSATIDNGGVAVNVDGGIVGLPFANHPFAVGETVRISNTTNYNGEFTLESGTTDDELQITDGYVAETFDGSEIVVKKIAVDSSAGRMVQDADGNLYYGHNYSAGNSTYVTKIETDGTLVFDFLNPPDWPLTGSGLVRGLAITPDSQFLYIYVDDGTLSNGFVMKYSLVTGNKIWNSTISPSPGYDLSVDADGNAYVPLVSEDCLKLASADGTQTILIAMGNSSDISVSAIGGCPYVSIVDEDMDIVIVAGKMSTSLGFPEDVLYNLAVRTFDNETGHRITVGADIIGAIRSTPTIGTGMLATRDGFIYVIAEAPTPKLFKISWDGERLEVVKTVDGPAFGIGIYFDLFGNLVVVNQDAITGQDEVMHFYDTDLNFISKTQGMYTSLLQTWDAAAGGAWQQGNAYFDGSLATSTVPAVTETSLGIGANSVAVIPGDGEDEVWLSVGRVVNDVVVRYIERMKPRDWGIDNEDMFFIDSGLTYDSTPTTSISGLSHLEGETVAILGDGAVLPTQVVSGGAITLDESVSVAQVGLPFTYKLKPMRMDQNTSKGTSKGSIKKIAEAVISFYKTLNAKYSDGRTTYKIPWRETSAEYSSPPDLVTGDKVVVADGGFDVEDPFQIEGNDPTPCSVRAIIPRIEITGR